MKSYWIRGISLFQFCCSPKICSNNILEGLEKSNYKLEFKTKNNEVRYLLVNATTRRDAENKIVGVVGVAQDVTESTKNDRAIASIANELR